MKENLKIPIEGRHDDVEFRVYPMSSKAHVFEKKD